MLCSAGKEGQGRSGQDMVACRVPVVGLVDETLCELKTFLNCFFNVQPDSAANVLCLLLLLGDSSPVPVLAFIIKLSLKVQEPDPGFQELEPAFPLVGPVCMHFTRSFFTRELMSRLFIGIIGTVSMLFIGTIGTVLSFMSAPENSLKAVGVVSDSGVLSFVVTVVTVVTAAVVAVVTAAVVAAAVVAVAVIGTMVGALALAYICSSFSSVG
jgi:hypothetical protein